MSSSGYLGTAHLMSFGVWFGASLWRSIYSLAILRHTVSKEEFGRIQVASFPSYFNFSFATLAISIGTMVMANGLSNLIPRSVGSIFSNSKQAQFFWLCAALVLTAGQIMVFSPGTIAAWHKKTELMRLKQEDTEAYKQAAKSFGINHGLSSLAEFLTWGVAIFHFAFIGRQISI